MHESSKEANNQYLLEIGLEEMPAGMILPAMEQLKKAAEKSLESNRLHSAKVLPFSSPRRLALLISELPEKQEDRIEELKGPPASIARDQDGAWSKAALGFAKKNGIEPDSLEVRNFDGRDYLYTAIKYCRLVRRRSCLILYRSISCFNCTFNIIWQLHRYWLFFHK